MEKKLLEIAHECDSSEIYIKMREWVVNASKDEQISITCFIIILLDLVS